MRARKWIIGGIASLVLMAVAVSTGSAWSGSGDFSPYSVYQGEPEAFTFNLYNQGGTTVDIHWVWVHFCWQSSNLGYYFKSDDGTSVPIPSHSSHDFTKTITVSESTLGTCEIETKVEGKAVGDWWAETKYFTDYISIKSIPTLQVSAVGNPNSGTAPLSVNFQTIVNGGLSPYTYSWSFGDGSTSSQQNPSHTYTAAGTFTAQVTVKDSASQRQTVSDSVTIHVSSPPDGTDGTDGTDGIGGGAAMSTQWLILVAIVGVIVAAVIAVAVYAARKKPPRMPQIPPPYQPPQQ